MPKIIGMSLIFATTFNLLFVLVRAVTFFGGTDYEAIAVVLTAFVTGIILTATIVLFLIKS